MNLDNVIKQGYLKKNTHSRRLTILFKRDMKRWFIFGVRDRRPYLEYYEKEESIFREPPINCFDLSNCKQITYTLSNRNPVYAFCIVWENHAMELSAYTRADMLDWCTKLENALRDLDIIGQGQVRGEDTEHVYVDADFLKRTKKDISEIMPLDTPVRLLSCNRVTVHGATSLTSETNTDIEPPLTRGTASLRNRRSWDRTAENKNYDKMLFNDDARLPSTSSQAALVVEDSLLKSKSFDTATMLKSMVDGNNCYQNVPSSFLALQTNAEKQSLELRDSGIGRSENSDENTEESVACAEDGDMRMLDYESICDWSTMQTDLSKHQNEFCEEVTEPKMCRSAEEVKLSAEEEFAIHASLAELKFKHSMKSSHTEPKIIHNTEFVKQDDAYELQTAAADMTRMTNDELVENRGNVQLSTSTEATDGSFPDGNFHISHSQFETLDTGKMFENTYVIMPGDYAESETDANIAENTYPERNPNEISLGSIVTSVEPISSTPVLYNAITSNFMSNEPTISNQLKPIHMSLRGRCDLLEDKEALKNIQLLLATCRSRGSSTTSSSVSGDTTGSYRHDSSSGSMATTYDDNQTGAMDEYERGTDPDILFNPDRPVLPVLTEQVHEDESESSAGSVMTVISQFTEGSHMTKPETQKRSPKKKKVPTATLR